MWIVERVPTEPGGAFQSSTVVTANFDPGRVDETDGIERTEALASYLQMTFEDQFADGLRGEFADVYEVWAIVSREITNWVDPEAFVTEAVGQINEEWGIDPDPDVKVSISNAPGQDIGKLYQEINADIERHLRTDPDEPLGN